MADFSRACPCPRRLSNLLWTGTKTTSRGHCSSHVARVEFPKEHGRPLVPFVPGSALSVHKYRLYLSSNAALWFKL